MRLVLFGHGPAAVVTASRLASSGHSIVGIVHSFAHTHRAADEKLPLFAQGQAIPSLTPKNVNDATAVEWVRDRRPDLNVCVWYNQILKPPMLAVAPFLNTHAGKLPNYRGRHVISWAIINDETELGLTIHFMDDWIDRGDIILQTTLPITWTDTYEKMAAKVDAAVPDLMVSAVRMVDNETAPRRMQRDFEGTYFTARMPIDTWIDWNSSSREIYNLVRAGAPPLLRARTKCEGTEFEVLAARYDPEWPRYRAAPGAVIGRNADGIRVKTGDSFIDLTRICPTVDTSRPFVPTFKIGTRLGSL